MTVARVTPRLAGVPPRLRWTNPRSVYRHYHFRARKIQPLRSLLTLYGVCRGEQVLLRQAGLYPKPDLVYRRHNYRNTEVQYAHSLGVPAITEVNGIVQDEAKLTWWATGVSNRFVAKWEKQNLGQADHYIVVSDYLKQVLLERFSVPESKITVVYNGVDTDRFHPVDINAAKKILDLDIHRTYVTFCGSMQPWQGLGNLIAAVPYVAAKFPAVQFLIAGSGICHDGLKEQAKACGDHITFLGQVQYNRVPLYISAATACVMPYTKKRNDEIGISPLKMGEYMACARPIVASNIRGLDCIEKHECGLLVVPDSPRSLASGICSLLENRQRAAWMGQNGRHYVVDNRSWKAAAEKTLVVCQNTIKEYKRCQSAHAA